MLRQTISVRLSDSLIKDVETLAAELSASLGFRVTPSDVMRRAIEHHIRSTAQSAMEPLKTK
jgi:predicted transcriptional regulator